MEFGAVARNVLLPSRETGLKQPSVAYVSQIISAGRTFLRERIGRVRPETMHKDRIRIEARPRASVTPFPHRGTPIQSAW